MPEPLALASQITIKVDGTELDPEVMTRLLSVTVDQHASLPDMFTIRLQDPDLQLIDTGPLDLTKEVEISAETAGGERVVLIKGEITALEPEFQEGMIARLVVRGYDRSHRLFREMKSRTHVNKKDSDLAQEIAREAGLRADIETTTAVYNHIFQHNQSDLAFLQARARRIGFECYVQEDTLVFRSPSNDGNGVRLTWGRDLLSFTPRMNLAEQVDEVIVRGWDVGRKSAVIGRAQRGGLYPRIGESKDGATWARDFGTGKHVIVDAGVGSQAEADRLAEARLNEISGAFVVAEGVALRRPDIRAGRAVTLEALGDRFSGTYLVTSARHLYTAEGLRTHFSVRGLRWGQLSEALSGGAREPRYGGVVIGIVTNTDDPQHWGRVKLKFPWMTDDAESAWARVLGIGAGPDAGLYVLPEVGDEVLVAFEHGGFGQPVVLGGLWNGQDAPPPEVPSSGNERPLVRTWHSRTGHRITMYDDADNKVEIITQGGHQIILDDANREITITSRGGLKITMEDSGGKITVEGNELQIKANGSLKIEAGANMDIQASGQVNIKGAMINLN